MTLFDARIVGPGRAGGSFAAALAHAGWRVDGPLPRGDHRDAGNGTALVVLAVPDAAVADVAASIAPTEAVVVHVAGSLGLDVLAPHTDAGSVHPLVSLPSPATGADRLVGAWFATAGRSSRAHDAVARLVAALDGRRVAVADEHRVAYHAAAAIAANHLVALLGQVERIATDVDVPLEAYLDLCRGALDNVAAVGPAAALTGPVARGDWETVARHLDALPADERPAYSVLADAARRLIGPVPARPTTAGSAA